MIYNHIIIYHMFIILIIYAGETRFVHPRLLITNLGQWVSS